MNKESMQNKNLILEIETGVDNPILRKKTEKIKEITPETQDLIQKMIKTSIEKGVGLSANQIGKSLRLFVVTMPIGREYYVNVYINPEIIELSGKDTAKEEGCLSLPNFYAKIKRQENVLIEYQDELGGEQKMKASGLLARIIQHEMDHLNGILICDKISN